jgi:ABC-type antimicrobial peptide transport system permease subunit
LLNIKKELNYNDVIVSSNFFRETFKEEFNSNKIGSYKFPNIVSIPLGEGMDPEIIFQGEDLNVIGTTEIPADYNNTLYSSMAIVVSDQYFEDFAKAQSYCCYITFPVPKDYKLKLQLFEYMEDKELFLSSIYSYTLYEISNIMNLYMELFGIIIFVITSVAVLLLSGYFSSIITTQKREIGIMRAMGLTRRFILKIYMPSGVIMSAFILVVSSSGLLILQKIINNSLTENFLNYLDSVAINNFKILTLNYVPFAVIFTLSILISMISMIIPVNKISRSNPVDTIRR